MGKRGPVKTPRALTELRGNPGRRTLPGPASPTARGEIPRTPAYLAGTSRTAWEHLTVELAGLGLFKAVDRYALETVCVAYGAWREALAKAKTRGRIERTRNGYEQVSAVHVVERQLRGDLLRGLAQFGATPSGRAGLSVNLDDTSAGLLQWLEEKTQRRMEGPGAGAGVERQRRPRGKPAKRIQKAKGKRQNEE